MKPDIDLSGYELETYKKCLANLQVGDLVFIYCDQWKKQYTGNKTDFTAETEVIAVATATLADCDSLQKLIVPGTAILLGSRHFTNGYDTPLLPRRFFPGNIYTNPEFASPLEKNKNRFKNFKVLDYALWVAKIVKAG